MRRDDSGTRRWCGNTEQQARMNRRSGLEYCLRLGIRTMGYGCRFSRRIRGDIMFPLGQVTCQHGDPGCVSDSTEPPGLRGTEPGKDGH